MRNYPRWLEFLLLIIAFALTAVAFCEVYLANYTGQPLAQQALRFALPMGSFLAAHWFLSFARPRSNQVLLPVSAGLTGIGLVYLYRIDAAPTQISRITGAVIPTHYFAGQSLTVVIGVVALIFMANIPSVLALSRYKYLCMVVGLGLLFVTAFMGDVVHGKALKITIAGFEFQPTELVKLLLVIFMAAYLADRSRLLSQKWGRWLINGEDIRYLGPLLAIWIASQALLFYQKDLGAALLFFGIFLAMIAIANARFFYQATGWLLFFGGATYAYFFSLRTQERIRIWIDPWKYGQTKGYQILQGLYALGFGGFFGAGLGHGAPQFIPAVQTDFVFLGLAEEIGMLGALGILALYMVLVWHGFNIACSGRTSFSSLLAAGLTIILTIQILVIVGGCLRIIPLTGIPVPFLSRGGTNMVCNLALIGILLAISAEEPAKEEHGSVI